MPQEAQYSITQNSMRQSNISRFHLEAQAGGGLYLGNATSLDKSNRFNYKN